MLATARGMLSQKMSVKHPHKVQSRVLFSYCQYTKWGQLTLAQMYASLSLCLSFFVCVCFLQCDREAGRSVDRGLTGVKWGSSQETQALNKVHTQTIIHSYTYSGQPGEPCFCGESTSTPITMCLRYTYLNYAEAALWSAYISYQNKTLNNPGLIEEPRPRRAVGCLLETARFLHCFVCILKPLHWEIGGFIQKEKLTNLNRRQWGDHWSELEGRWTIILIRSRPTSFGLPQVFELTGAWVILLPVQCEHNSPPRGGSERGELKRKWMCSSAIWRAEI